MDRPQVLREVHTLGGGRVVNGIDDVAVIQPGPVGSQELKLLIGGFTTLYSDVANLGLTVIGCDFYHGGNDHNPPEWRPKNVRGESAWICSDQGHKWSFLAHAAYQEKQGRLYDICARISHQIRSCEWRLRQLSEAYTSQLYGRLKSGRFAPNERFLDGHTSLCYLAFQSYLVDASVLRDYLAEFYSEVMLRPYNETIKVAAIKGLLNIWKKAPPTDEAGLEFKYATDEGNWLSELGAYRNLVVHTAPLARAGRTLLAFTRVIELTDGQMLPSIKMPVPLNPSGIIGSRTSGEYFDDPELGFAPLKNSIDDQSPSIDALEYAHLSLQKLAKLCDAISTLAPFAPEIPTIIPRNLTINWGSESQPS